ncbi:MULTISPECIES: hypothetical protein [unclassified Microcoleus]|uniref:hypothetical protein n=1 Tax=unclassified Microcoleus TaxID=2642155 RepID=UPI002FCF663B
MTATTDHPLKHFCIEDLKSANLAGISLIPQPLTLRLDFTFGTGIYDTSIEFYQLVHQVISQPVNSDPEESCFWVGNAELRQMQISHIRTLQIRLLDALRLHNWVFYRICEVQRVFS